VFANLFDRFRLARRFARSAASWRDVPTACLLGIARGSPFNGSNTLTKLGQQWFPVVGLRPRDLGGAQVWLDTSDLGQLLSYEEILVDQSYDLGLVPFVPTVVMDCGAHVGFFTRLAASKYPAARLLAFEPNPANRQMLERQLEPLGPRVGIYPAAIGLADGEVGFTAEESNAGHVLGHGVNGHCRVKALDFRRVLSQESGEPLLLKIDIEGEERRLIPAIVDLLPRRCALFFETHHGTAGWREVSEALADRGFHVRILRARDQFNDGFALRDSPTATP